MSAEYSEDKLVQETYANYFRDDLGWQTIFAYNEETLGSNATSTLGRTSQTETILTCPLRAALIRLNPGHPTTAYDQAIETLTTYNPSTPLLTLNRDNYKLLRDGIPVKYDDPATGDPIERRLKPIDFDTADSNEFLIVRELWIQGPVQRCRPDILGFINGIPLLFIELKRTDKNIQTAYDQNLTNYKTYIPELFHHNAICLLSNGDRARVGTFASPYTFFNEWKRLEEDEKGRVDFETMLMGICNKQNFLDLVENFILFDDSSGDLIKIIARNHQYLGVNQVIEQVENRNTLINASTADPDQLEESKRLGVFWHTQGSGKSYSMVFLTQKVLRKIGGYSFLIVTDRQELDGQIAKTYLGTGAVKAIGGKLPNQATSGEALKQLLKDNKRYVFSLIHKFNQDITDDSEAYSPRKNIIVLSDEAHRTQYGKYAVNMRKAIPHAAFIGFTGTPLMDSEEDQKTKEVFGDYVSIYDFQRAIEDNATVPLYYDNRGEKLEITTDDINARVAAELEKHDLTEEDESRLMRRLGSDYAIITNADRLDHIAADLVKHFSDRWQTGKAMLVCIDKITTVRLYNLIDTYWQAEIKAQEKQLRQATDEQDKQEQQRKLTWLNETQYRVVVSHAADEIKKFSDWDLDITPHRQVMNDNNLEADFRNGDHPFRLAIVCAMWLTGFDVPSLATLYIDKAMRGHTLMQTIARANRVAEGKNNGLLVDYSGILKSFRAALAKYGSAAALRAANPDSPAEPDDTDESAQAPYNDMEKLRDEYDAAIQACIDLLSTFGFDLAKLIQAEGIDKIALLSDDGPALNAICTNDESRIRFEVFAQDMMRKHKALVGRFDLIGPYSSRYNALEMLYKKLLAMGRSQTDLGDIFRAICTEVGDAIEVKATQLPGAPSERIYDLSKIDFDRLKAEFEKSPAKQVQVQEVKDAIAQRLKKLLQQNPQSQQRRDLYARYQEIVSRYNQETDRLTIEQTFEELLNLVDALDTEEKRHVREGLSEPDLALFDILCNYKAGIKPATRERLKQVAHSLLQIIQAQLQTLENWQEKGTTKSQVETLILNHLYSDETGLPVDDFEEDEVNELAKVIFLHVYQHPPSDSPDERLRDQAA